VIKMHGPDEAQLPLVKSFGQDLDRAIARRARSPKRSRRRVLSVVCAAGLLGASLLTSPGRAASGVVGDWLGLAEPGDPPSVEGPRPRGGLGNEPTGSVVVAAGRAPDGARYEFVLERLSESPRPDRAAERSRQCLNIEWPDARAGQISPQFGCYAEFPPAALQDAVVRRQGAMFDPTYTSQVQIAGFARADVSEVRILYRDDRGAERDAPVRFASVTGEVQRRAGVDRPFGVFIGFLPQAWLGYGALFDPRQCPPEERPYDAQAIEVIAYDHQGQAIARETGNNILSVGGRPPCQ
jgi:hypothetical protein